MTFSFFRAGRWLAALLLLLAPAAQAAAPLAKGPRKGGKDDVVTIATPEGTIRLLLFQDTPLHRANFLQKARKGFYNGTTFHRIIDGFMIQGGDANSKDDDPTNDGQGRPGDPTVPAELGPGHPHVYGAVAAARTGGPAGTPSSSSQFYLVENHGGTHRLDGQYTVFGQVIQGLDVVDKIAKVPKDNRDRPLTNVPMTMKVEHLRKKKITKLYGYQYP
ncbi:MAG: peptidylprolyl isomerase [Janthinobacterium lividum]